MNSIAFAFILHNLIHYTSPWIFLEKIDLIDQHLCREFYVKFHFSEMRRLIDFQYTTPDTNIFKYMFFYRWLSYVTSIGAIVCFALFLTSFYFLSFLRMTLLRTIILCVAIFCSNFCFFAAEVVYICGLMVLQSRFKTINNILKQMLFNGIDQDSDIVIIDDNRVTINEMNYTNYKKKSEKKIVKGQNGKRKVENFEIDPTKRVTNVEKRKIQDKTYNILEIQNVLKQS